MVKMRNAAARDASIPADDVVRSAMNPLGPERVCDGERTSSRIEHRSE